MPALNRAGAMVGDRVTLTIESGVILSRMALLYLVPVVGMLAGAFTGTVMSPENDGNGLYAIVFALVGFALGLALSVFVSRSWSNLRPVTPVITRIIHSSLASPASRSPTSCTCKSK
jgi:positive regulator of sigma E activity